MAAFATLWWVWLSGALVLAILEILSPGFMFLGFAIGAAIVAGIVALPVSPGLPALAAIFAGLSLIAWIALRHDIRYRSEAFLGDQLEAKVLLRGFRGSRSQFEIQFSRGSVSVAEVDTTLCCIDRETRQLHRITHELARHFAIVA